MNFIVGSNQARNIKPVGRQFRGDDQRAPLANSLKRWGHFEPGQTAGRFYPIACVALEIVQRCNLDCTLCYLSDTAEMAHDVPLGVLYSRIDMIQDHYGRETFVQITGGDPTLRSVEDLENICRYIRRRKMFSCLMTNGIKASDDMLGRLAVAGLNDIAFHVDTTQQRKGYASEKSLNPIRIEYIRRARRAGLRVLFNTTIHDGNFKELPVMARFFRENVADIALTSFQMQADTGRGVVCARSRAITQQSVMAALQSGMQVALDFDTFSVGHTSCTRYASILSAGTQVIPAVSDPVLFHDIMAVLEGHEIRIGAYLNLPATVLRAVWRHPILAMRALGNGFSRLWQLRKGLLASRGKIHRMAVLIHNFMDADNLEQDRCETCVFMVATENGPLSMCVHNARRDHYVYEPAAVQTASGAGWWSAATGQVTDDADRRNVGNMPFKRLKGRMRAVAEAKKLQGKKLQGNS